MKTLSFLGKFRVKLLAGEKNITIRLKLRPKVKEGERVKIDCGGKIIGTAVIKRIYTKRISELTEEEIKRDGFESKEEFLNFLSSCFKEKLEKDRTVYVIEFEMVEKKEEDHYESNYGNYSLEYLANVGLNLDILSNDEKEILKKFLKYKSIRAVAMELGGLNKRYIIRKILRKIAKYLNNGRLSKDRL